MRADLAGPGLTRRRRGRGFSYHGIDGEPITDPAELARIKALVIPPAWRDVWIASDLDAHIQAVGTDDAGRRAVLLPRRVAQGLRHGEVRAGAVLGL